MDRSKIDTDLLMDYLNLDGKNEICHIYRIHHERISLDGNKSIGIHCTFIDKDNQIKTSEMETFYFVDEEYEKWLKKIERNKKINGLLK